jgi:hypothetical protein
MRRLTAIFLLLFALAGTCVPLAMAAVAAPQHACCLRKAHHCHDSATSDSEQLIISGAACCNHDCCRDARTSRSANPQAAISSAFVESISQFRATLGFNAPAAATFNYRSTRAPPQLTLA